MPNNERLTRSQARQAHREEEASIQNDLFPSSQVLVPAALLENAKVKEFCSFIVENGNQDVAQSSSYDSSMGEVKYRLLSLEKGQERQEEQLHVVRSKLESAIQDIDARLKAINAQLKAMSPSAPNAPSYFGREDIRSTNSIPLPIGYHLSPNRPSHLQSESMQRQIFPTSGYYSTADPSRKHI